jgi:hypothetical protein
MSNSLTDLDRFRSDSFEPTSFRERGATIPFTTPLLLNARIRNAASGRGFEMVVTNPSGGRGALILPWWAMPDICSPTLFDRHLWESLSTSDDISPIGIRHEAQRLATLGLAGRHAALAAKDAQRREQASQRLVRSMLLESLITATETANEATGRSVIGTGEAFVKRAERAVARAAALAGLPLLDFTGDLERLALALSGAIPEIEGEDARLRQMQTDLQRMADDITDWTGGQQQEEANIMAANFIVATARQTLECAEVALAHTDALIADLGLLMPQWRAEKESIFERARRPDWVLDGWKTPMALWHSAGPNERPAAIWEIALIAPILPREAKAWLGEVNDWRDTPRRITQVVRDKSDWRSGNQMELVARNENLIGFSIAYENRISPMVLPRGKTNVDRSKKEGEANRRDIIPKTVGTTKKQARRQNESTPAAPASKNASLSEIRALGNMIEIASDQALKKIVELVDRLSSPEVHERLLGPSLRRLKRLRPPRPASLRRLLFMPLAGALADPFLWRRAEGRIPRSALGPLLGSLTQVLGTQIEASSVQLRGSSFENEGLVDRVGRPLWQAAGAAAQRLRYDASWSREGLGQQDFDSIVSLAGALWRHAGPLWDGMRRVASDCQPEDLRDALIGPANDGSFVFAAALDALLQRAARPSNFVGLLRDLPIQALSIVEEVLNGWVGTTLPELMEEDFATGARLAREVGIVLASLEELPRVTARTDAKELVAHRRTLDQFCRTSYREIVSTHVIQAILEISSDDSEALGEIEGMARIARSLEDVGRRVGSAKPYEDLQEDFRRSMEVRGTQQAKSGMTAMELARIEEILIGHEAAERFLSRARRLGLRNR